MSNGINFYILDVETTGLMVAYHSICEISIIRASDRTQLTRQVKVEKPENASIDALKIIKKSINELRMGDPDYKVINDIEFFLKEDGLSPAHRCLCGHNIINFDRRFLWNLWAKYNKEFPFNLYLDTMQMYKGYIKKIGAGKVKTNLSDACDALNIKKMGTAHNAKYDTQNTYFLWEKLNQNIDFLDHIKQMPHSLSLDE